ncbi:MAG: hypothetical protein ACOCUU_01190 [Nanoarchaeota archaeon]
MNTQLPQGIPATSVKYGFQGSTREFKEFQNRMWSAYDFPYHVEFEGTDGSLFDKFVFQSGQIYLFPGTQEAYLNPEVDREANREIFQSQLEKLHLKLSPSSVSSQTKQDFVRID